MRFVRAHVTLRQLLRAAVKLSPAPGPVSLRIVFEPLIYGGCLPRERNVIGHFFVVVKITS